MVVWVGDLCNLEVSFQTNHVSFGGSRFKQTVDIIRCYLKDQTMRATKKKKPIGGLGYISDLIQHMTNRPHKSRRNVLHLP